MWKAVKKGRTKEEVDEIICWLTGYSIEELEHILRQEMNFEIFFKQAPQINPNASKIRSNLAIGWKKLKTTLYEKHAFSTN